MEDYFDKLCDKKFLRIITDLESPVMTESTFLDPWSSVYEFDSNFIRMCIYSLIPFSVRYD